MLRPLWLLLLLPTVAVSAAAQDSTTTTRRDWSIGARIGMGSPNGVGEMYQGKGAGASGLFAEVRRPGSRLGFRLEYLQRAQVAHGVPNSPCVGCSNTTERLDRAAQLTMTWEFRQGSKVRPFMLFGAGIGTTTDIHRIYEACTPTSCTLGHPTSSATWRRERATTSLGTGVAWHVGRVVPFAEARLGHGTDVFTVGFRVRPFGK